MNAGVREYWIVDPYNETITAYDFQSDVYPLHYTFNDTVPVSISGGECTIDFRRIKDVLIRQFG
jgi:Uma2 family endonuclease